MCRGVNIQTSPYTVFLSLLDLILLSLIKEYPTKKEIFLNIDLGLSIHCPSFSFPGVGEDYFASLPSTTSDESTVHSLLSKKQVLIPSLDGVPKEIATSIVSQMMISKVGVKTLYSSPIPVDYGV